MIDQELRRRLSQEIKNLIPLFRYLFFRRKLTLLPGPGGGSAARFFPVVPRDAGHFQKDPALGQCLGVLLQTVQSYFPVNRGSSVTTWQSG